jgi:hypothetical protein
MNHRDSIGVTVINTALGLELRRRRAIRGQGWALQNY